MRKRRNWLSMVVILVMLGGCGGPVTVDQAIMNAYQNLIKAESYAFEAEVQLKTEGKGLDLPPEEIRDLRIARGADHPLMLLIDKETRVTLNGVYDRNRNLVEAELEMVAAYSEDMSLTMHSVVVMTEEHTWIKVPENAASMMGRPELRDKYYDLGYGYNFKDANADIGKLGEKLLKVIVEGFNEIALTSIDADDLDAPNEARVVTAGRFSVTDDNLENTLIAAVQVVPDLIDLCLDPEWKNSLGLEERELLWEKERYTETTSEAIQFGAEKIKSEMAIRQADLDLGMDKHGGLTYAGVKLDVKIVYGEESLDIKGDATMQISAYNKKHELQHGIPQVGEVFFE